MYVDAVNDVTSGIIIALRATGATSKRYRLSINHGGIRGRVRGKSSEKGVRKGGTQRYVLKRVQIR